jgi:very-short-patch-repair endonuclease
VAGREVDMLFAEQRVIVELDGWDFHRDRYAFEDDRERDANGLAAGFVTLRVTWGRLTTSAGLEARRLRAILDSRGLTSPA